MGNINPHEALGVRPLVESMKPALFKQITNVLTLDWIFDKAWEKILIVLCFAWSSYSIFKWIFIN